MNRDDVKILAARTVLRWRSRPGPIRAAARGSVPPPAAAEREGIVRVAAVQMEARLAPAARDFAGRMASFVRQARESGAELVVFPEDNGTQLLGLLPGLARLAAGVDLNDHTEGGGISVADVIRLVSPFTTRVFTETFASLAKAYGVAIVSGSIRRVAEDGRLVNAAYCYGPDGRLLGIQEKLHLMSAEAAWGFAPGRDLAVASAGRLQLAFPICHDATFFETFRLAYARGAQVVAVQSANPEAFNEWYARRGIWPRVQETPVYGIASHLVGALLGLRFTGQSGIYAPCGLTPLGDGVLAQADDAEREGIVLADLDLNALAAWRQSHPLVLPAGVILSHLPGLYERGAGRRVSAAAHGKHEEGQEEREEHLAAEEGRQCPASAEAMPARQADVQEEDAPAVEEKKDEGRDVKGEEAGDDGQQGGQGQDVGNLGVTVDEQVGEETAPAAQEAGEDRHDGRPDQPAPEDEGRGEEHQEKA